MQRRDRPTTIDVVISWTTFESFSGRSICCHGLYCPAKLLTTIQASSDARCFQWMSEDRRDASGLQISPNSEIFRLDLFGLCPNSGDVFLATSFSALFPVRVRNKREILAGLVRLLVCLRHW